MAETEVVDKLESKADTITVPDTEPVKFSDNPDGTPATDVLAKETTEAVEAEAPRRRNRKDYQTRIGELTRERHESAERAAAAEARADLLEEELRAARASTSKATDADAQRKESELRERKKKALDEADLVAYDAAQEELFELRAQRLTKPEPIAERRAEAPTIHESAKKWLSGNDWFSKQENAALAETVRDVESRLRKQGMQFGDDLYKKLDEELSKLPEFDDVRGKKVDDKVDDEIEEERSVVARPSRVTEPTAVTTRPNALTKYDIETMRRFKLNPNDPKHRESYLARKSRAA